MRFQFKKEEAESILLACDATHLRALNRYEKPSRG